MLGAKVYEYFMVMVSGNNCKYCNVFASQKTVFLRFQNSHTAQIMRLVFGAALKRLAYNASAIIAYCPPPFLQGARA